VLPHVLSLLTPLFVYTALVMSGWGIYRERVWLDRWGLLLAAGAFIAPLTVRPNEHLLFFDEDIYIQIASNLSHAPVAQLTLFGGPGDIQASTYYKEPAGFPVILSLIFAITGTHEKVAFVVARLLYAMAVVVVYLLGRRILKTRLQAVVASLAFAATPACFAFSASTGTDLPAALFAAWGVLGIAAGNGMLAAGGLAMAAQIRLEMIVLAPMILLADRVSPKWKTALAVLIVPEILHIAWVLSISPALAKVEHVNSAFSPAYIFGNLVSNLRFLFDPRVFPIAAAVLAVATVIYRRNSRIAALLWIWTAVLFVIYLTFYAGSFDTNPRYSIQLTIPIILLATSFSDRLVILATVAISAILPATRPWQTPDYVQALASDHRTAVDFAQKVGPNDLVIAGEPEIFINQGKHAMNAVFGTDQIKLIRSQLEKADRVYYYSGVRTNEAGSQQWEADRKVKSEFELHLIDAREFSGLRVRIYELLNPIHRERGQVGALEDQTHGSQLRATAGKG
jgi:hypothetical protein